MHYPLHLALAILLILLTPFNTLTQNPNSSNDQLIADTCQANNLMVEAELLVNSSQFEKAVDQLKAASSIYQSHALWEQSVFPLILAAQHADNIDYFVKDALANQALNLCDIHLDSLNIQRANTYRQKGEAALAFQKNDSAQYYFQLATPIFLHHKDWNNTGLTKILEVFTYYYQEDLQKANTLLKEPFWNEHHFDENIGDLLLDLQGVISYQYGDIERAIEKFEESYLTFLNKPNRSSVDSSFLATYLNNLGSAYSEKGNYERSIDYYHSAKIIFSNIPNEATNIITINSNIGNYYLRLKQYDKAIKIYRENIQQIQTNNLNDQFPEQIGESLHQIGIAYRELGIIDSAFFYFNAADDYEPDHTTSFNPISKANAYLKIGQPSKALELLQEIDEDDSFKESLTPRKRVELELNKGNAYQQLQLYDQGIEAYQLGISIILPSYLPNSAIEVRPNLNKKVDKPIYLLKLLKAKGQILQQKDNTYKSLKASLNSYLSAVDWIDSLKESHILEKSTLIWGSLYREIYEEAISVTHKLYLQKPSTELLNTAFKLSEKSKANLLLQAFSAQSAFDQSNIPAEILNTERNLSIDIAYYEKAKLNALEAKDTLKAELFQNYTSEKRIELAHLKEQIKRNYSDYYQLKHANTQLNIETIQQNLLKDDNALLAFFIGQESGFIFAITPQDADIYSIAVGKNFQQKLNRFKAELTKIDQFQLDPQQAFIDFNQISLEAFQTLFPKDLIHKISDLNKLIIIPDASLNNIPFEILNTEKASLPSNDFSNLPYLLKSYSIQYAYSSNLLNKNIERQANLSANSKCLAFAPPYETKNPIAQDIRSSQLRNGIVALENTANEIKAIKNTFNGTFDYSPTATKANFIEQASEFGILHLAMHGEADFENAKFGHLIFTNIGMDSSNQNLLFNYEIANLPLQSQLVVLSACETGVGKYEEGEGVFSLARAFMYAGVPSVVMSLWKVDDQSTSKIMPLFYQNLAKGTNKAVALQAAKLEYLENTTLEYRHPFYWSSFVAMGSAEPLQKASLFSTPLLIGIGLLIIGIGFFLNKRIKK